MLFERKFCQYTHLHDLKEILLESSNAHSGDLFTIQLFQWETRGSFYFPLLLLHEIHIGEYISSVNNIDVCTQIPSIAIDRKCLWTTVIRARFCLAHQSTQRSRSLSSHANNPHANIRPRQTKHNCGKQAIPCGHLLNLKVEARVARKPQVSVG